ncbi:MAG: hypothetical protein V4629_04470 [Pseudomonadota bacterium]
MRYQGCLRKLFLINATKALILLCSMFLSLGGCVTETINPGNMQVNEDRRYQVAVEAAAEYLKANDVANADRHLQRALKINPKSAAAYNLMAALQTIEGNPKLVETYYKKSIGFDESYSPALYNYGQFLLADNRCNVATKYLEKAAQDFTYPQRSMAFEALSICQRKLGELDEAQVTIDKAIRLSPENPNLMLEQVEVYLAQKKLEMARDTFLKFSKVAPHTRRSVELGLSIARQLNDTGMELEMQNVLKNMK